MAQLLRDDDNALVQTAAVEALEKIGPDAVPFIQEVMTRMSAAVAEA